MFKRLADGCLKRTGFSLIELSVVLVVTSLMLGFGLQAVQSTGSVDCNAITKQQVVTVQAAVEKFVKSHNYYPKPAGRGWKITDPQFGRSDTSGAPSFDTNNGVLLGALPFQTLGLPASFAADCWGNKFTYAVTANLTSTTQAVYNAANGSIQINSAPGTPVMTSAAYAVISHGADGNGGAKKNGGTNHTWNCTAGHADSQNCSATNVVLAAAFNNGKNAGAGFFDDYVVYGQKGQSINQDCLNTPCGTVHSGSTCTLYAQNLPAGACSSEVQTCNNGTMPPFVMGYAQTSCIPGCPTQTINWGFDSGCSATIGALSSGSNSGSVSNTAGGGHAGAATATCTNGAIALSGTSCVINATCGASPNTCAAGTASGFSAGACGGTQTWTCNGANGGSNAACSMANAACPSCAAAPTCGVGVSSGDSGTACGTNRTWTCTSSNAISTYSAACSIANPACACTSAACGTTLNGGNCTSYSSATAVSPATCASIQRTSNCSGGNWDVAPYANGSCSVVHAGVCNNAVALGCSTGTAISDNGLTGCGTTRGWICQSPDGGPNSAACSKANAACITGVCNSSTPLGCTTGTAISDNGLTACATTRTWVCQSPNGGANSGTCSYSNPCNSDGVCGAGNGTCSAGTVGSYVPGSCSGTATWYCSGTGTGLTVSCCNSNAACIAGVCNNSTPLGCTAGTAISDNGLTGCGTTRTWTCQSPNGGSNSPGCSYANAACITGVCNNTVALGCSAGTAISDNGQTACGTTRTWVCQSPNGGANSGGCSKANAACPVNGVCNNASAWACSAGNAINGYDPGCGGTRTWQCQGLNGGTTDTSCNQYTGACPVNAVCGGGAATCSVGTYAGNYNAGACNGSQTWTCTGANGGSNASCSIANAACPVNGSCGGGANTCAAGSASGYSAGSCGGSQTWTCNGANGGSNASCSIANAACPVNGSCGSGGACNAGSPSGDNGQTACGTTRTWTCNGSGGGSNASCSEANAACAGGCSAGQCYWIDSCGNNEACLNNGAIRYDQWTGDGCTDKFQCSGGSMIFIGHAGLCTYTYPACP